MPTPEKLRLYSSDPMAFIADLFIPSAHGVRRYGDVMADFQRERFAQIAPSILAVARGQQPPCGRFAWEGTKSSAKDTDLACVVLWFLCFATRPVSAMIGAADAEQAGLLRDAAKAIVRLNPWLSERISVQRDAIVCDANDSRADVVAADTSGGAHGRRDDLTIINELSHIPDSRFEAPLTWMDNADKRPGGLALLAFNAGFVHSIAYRWRENARTSPDWTFHSYSRPAPWLSEKHLRDAERRNPPERFARLYWGRWSHGSGQGLPHADIEAAVDEQAEPHIVPALPAYCAAIDLGIKHDASAFCVLGCDPINGRAVLAHTKTWLPADYGGRVNLDDVLGHVLSVHRRLQLGVLIYDPWQAEFLSDQLRARGLRTFAWQSSPPNLQVAATVLLEAFRNGQVSLYRDKELLRDLDGLSVVEKQTGYRLEARRTARGHLDLGVAFSMCIPTCLEWCKSISFAVDAPTPLEIFA